MAYILKRKWKNKTTYRVQVTRKGFKSAFKSFPTRTEAKKWGRTMENKLDRGRLLKLLRGNQANIRRCYEALY